MGQPISQARRPPWLLPPCGCARPTIGAKVPAPVTAAELAALRAEVAKLRERTNAMVRVIGIFYDAGRDDKRREHQPWAEPWQRGQLTVAR